MKHLKLISAALALALCAGLFAACGTGNTTAPSASGSTSAAASGSTSADTKEPAHEPGLFVDDKKIEADPIMTVDGADVPFDLFRYHYLAAKYRFDGGDSTVWASSEDAEGLKADLLEYATQGVLSGYAIEAIAKDNNIALSDEETKGIDDELSALNEQLGGEEAYNTALSQQFYTPDVYKQMYTTSVLMEKVIRSLYGEQIKADVLQNYVHAQHILIPFTDAEAEEHADDLKKAEEVLAKVKAGDDFSALMKEYSQDPGQPEEGYYFTKGDMVQEFEDAAYALKDDETSEIVATSYGYHILKRLPMEDSYIEENLTTLLGQEVGTQITTDFDNRVKEFAVTYHDNYKLVAPDTLF